MTEIRHHLTDALLMGYSAGSLPEAFSLVVATHISMCDECRARMHAFDSLGGALLDDETTASAPLAPDSLERTLGRIANQPEKEARPAPRPEGAVLPGPLRDYVGGDLEAVAWRSLGGGVKQAVLRTSKDASVRLLQIPGGAAMPDHGHRGTELTLVLKGAYRDESDRFAAGDVEVANEEVDHRPVAEPDEICICLAASDAPLRFKSLLPRLVQPFFGI